MEKSSIPKDIGKTIKDVNDEHKQDLLEKEIYENMGIIKSANIICKTIASNGKKVVCDELMNSTLLGEMRVKEYLGTLERKFPRNKKLQQMIKGIKKNVKNVAELDELEKTNINSAANI